ncbi:MAG TPA: hypothetical protein VGG74_03985 [Kofleriaceae bacterium]
MDERALRQRRHRLRLTRELGMFLRERGLIDVEDAARRERRQDQRIDRMRNHEAVGRRLADRRLLRLDVTRHLAFQRLAGSACDRVRDRDASPFEEPIRPVVRVLRALCAVRICDLLLRHHAARIDEHRRALREKEAVEVHVAAAQLAGERLRELLIAARCPLRSPIAGREWKRLDLIRRRRHDLGQVLCEVVVAAHVLRRGFRRTALQLDVCPHRFAGPTRKRAEARCVRVVDDSALGYVIGVLLRRGRFAADRLRTLRRILRGVLLLRRMRELVREQRIAGRCPLLRRVRAHHDVVARGKRYRIVLRRHLVSLSAAVNARIAGPHRGRGLLVDGLARTEPLLQRVERLALHIRTGGRVRGWLLLRLRSGWIRSDEIGRQLAARFPLANALANAREQIELELLRITRRRAGELAHQRFDLRRRTPAVDREVVRDVWARRGRAEHAELFGGRRAQRRLDLR